MADVTSANIVGYAGNGLKQGATLLSAQFKDVAGGKFSLDNFRPNGTELSDNIALKILDAYGREITSYVWIEWGGEGGDECYWSPEGGGDKAEGVEFEPGQAFWVQGSDASQFLQSSGEVSMNDCTCELRQGATLIGNGFPTKVDLNDILASGEELSDNIAIKILDGYGREITSYVWIEWGGEGGDECYWSPEGGGDKAEGVEFEPGQAFWVQGSVDKTEDNVGQYITFPAPEL